MANKDTTKGYKGQRVPVFVFELPTFVSRLRQDKPAGQASGQDVEGLCVLEEIKTACLRSKDVVLQLLSIARKADLEKKPTNIVQVVREALKLLRCPERYLI